MAVIVAYREIAGSDVRSSASTATPFSIDRPACAAKPVLGEDADCEQHDVGGEARARGGLDARHAAVLAQQRGHALAEAQIDAERTVLRLEGAGHRLGDGAHHHAGRSLQDGDLQAELRGDGGEFEPDEAGSHDHRAARAGDLALQALGVGKQGPGARGRP